MPIDRAAFAVECVNQGVYIGVPPHLLLGMAELRSGISDGGAEPRIGPFRVTEDEWKAHLRDEALDIDLPVGMRGRWPVQCIFAALGAKRAREMFLLREERYPNAVELYREQWVADPAAAAADLEAKLQAALDATAPLLGPAFDAALGPQTGDPPETGPIVRGGDDVTPPRPGGGGPAPAKHELLFVAKAPWIMERLMDEFDLEDFQAAGILGNIGHECAGFREFQEIGVKGRGGFGWCQWTGPRREAFEAFCRDEGLSSLSDEANYGYLRQELETTEKEAIPKVKATLTVTAAVRAFEKAFERAKVKHFERRDRWATLALSPFRRALPPGATLLLQSAAFHVVGKARDGTTRYFLVEEGGDSSARALLEKRDGKPARLLGRDTALLPLDGLGLPAGVAQALGKDLQEPGPEEQGGGGDGDPGRAVRLLSEAKKAEDRLVTKDAPGTSRGKLACAFAVNEVAKRAFGAPIGGGLSTTKMGEELAKNHEKLKLGAVVAGAIVISPTSGKRVGHVGIVGDIAAPLDATPIYSNSSSRGLFMRNFTIGRWRTMFTKKRLAVEFYLP